MNKDFPLISSKGLPQPIHTFNLNDSLGAGGIIDRFLLHSLVWLELTKIHQSLLPSARVKGVHLHTQQVAVVRGGFFVVGWIERRSSDILSTRTTTKLNLSGSLK